MNKKCIFLIPVFNRKENIKRIVENEYLMNNFYFLFIDDHSTDGTMEELKKYSLDKYNVKYIKTKNPNSFWYGAIYEGIEYLYELSKYQTEDYDFFGFMNDDIDFTFFNDLNLEFDECSKTIYFAPAYWKSKNKYTAGEANGILMVSDKKDELLGCEYSSIGGFFTIFPYESMKHIYFRKLPDFIKHYHADTLISLDLVNSGFIIKPLKYVEVIIDDNDKTRLANMSFLTKLTDVRSPYEWRSSIYWYIMSKSELSSFFIKLTKHFGKCLVYGLYFKIRRYIK